MRKLVTIQTIKSIQPIPDADNIELATMVSNAWKCVVLKGQFKPGDRTAYFEIDSLIPPGMPQTDFLVKDGLRTNFDGFKGYRLRTMMLRKVLSQGLLIPFSDYTSIPDGPDGSDITNYLGVRVFEPPIPACLDGVMVGVLPPCIKSTDQERIQNIPTFMADHAGWDFEATIKVDGTSCTYFDSLDRGFGVCGHQYQFKRDGKNSFWIIAEELHIEERLDKVRPHGHLGYALQGELAGEGIQANPDKLRGKHFFMFDVWDIEERRHLLPVERMEMLDKLNSQPGGHPKIEHVPILDRAKPIDYFLTVDELLAYANGPGMNHSNGGKLREGVVFKANRRDGNGQVPSFKVLSNKKLLKDG